MHNIQEASWGLIIPSHDTRPVVTIGATVTPAQNTKGNWATVLAGASVTDDVFMIDIAVDAIETATLATDSLTDIGVDPAGGTTPLDPPLIPDLLTSYASKTCQNALASGWRYRFRVKIKAGSTIMARGSINNATVGTQLVRCTLYCRPSRPVKAGSIVLAYGVNAAASAGTAVTAGTTSVGAYTQLGSAIVAPVMWDWSVAAAPDNLSTIASGQAVTTDLAIGDATTKKRIIAQQHANGDTSERWSCNVGSIHHMAPVGDLVYARCWSHNTTTTFTAIAYGTGG